MHPIEITDANFEEEVLKSEIPVLIDFWAVWCYPCQILGPVIEEISNEMKDKVKVMKLNVDENPKTSQSFNVMSIPTVMLFKDGKAVETFIGVQPKGVYTNAISKYIK